MRLYDRALEITRPPIVRADGLSLFRRMLLHKNVACLGVVEADSLFYASALLATESCQLQYVATIFEYLGMRVLALKVAR